MENLFHNLLSSGLATLCAELITLPICTVKSNYQVNEKKGIISTVKEVYKRKGVRSFFSASFPAMGGQIISTSLKYAIYEQLKKENNIQIGTVGNGLISGIASSVVTHPLDVVRVTWQLNKRMSDEVKQEGLKIVYRGYSKSLMKVSVGSMLFFPIYDSIKSKLDHPLLASFSSSIVSTTIMQPLDYMKTRHMAGKSPWSSSLKGYFKGFSLNLLRIVPHFTITMTATEFIKRKMIVVV